eukprot:6177817-Pleurochrysis_carterae.AAC.4
MRDQALHGAQGHLRAYMRVYISQKRVDRAGKERDDGQERVDRGLVVVEGDRKVKCDQGRHADRRKAKGRVGKRSSEREERMGSRASMALDT